MSHAESAATHVEARQQVEQRWRTAFENSAIGITMADFAGHFFAANSVFRCGSPKLWPTSKSMT